MKKLFILMLSITIIIGFSSCENDDENSNFNFNYQALEVVETNIPDTFDLGRRYEIEVTYIRPDACTRFAGFDVVPQDSIREVFAIGSVYTDQACAQVIQEETNSFYFDVLFDQTYVFRFWQGEDANGNAEYLEIQVPVE